jgi:hypothetical protein
MKIFCVSHTFTPLFNAEAIQAARILGALRGMGHQVLVFTAADQHVDDVRGDVAAGYDGRVVGVNGREFRFAMRVIRKIAPGFASMPDSNLLWYFSTRQTALAAAKKFEPDVIYSRSQPFTSALVAASVSRRLDIPHVASFSDPWVNNPYATRGLISGRLNRALERSVVQSAAHLTTTTDWVKNDLTDRYGETVRGRISTLSHAFDPALFKQEKPVVRGQFTVAHIGNLYGNRTAVPIVVAANKVADVGELPNAFKIRLVGVIDKKEAGMIEKVDSGGLVEMTGTVSYEQSVEEMMRADLLLSIDGPGDVSFPFLPSKLIEYLGARKRILALTERGSPSYKLIDELGAAATSPSNINEIAAALRESIKSTASGYDSNVIDRHEVGNVVAELGQILESTVDSRG